MRKHYKNPNLEITELFLHTGICSNPAAPKDDPNDPYDSPGRRLFS